MNKGSHSREIPGKVTSRTLNTSLYAYFCPLCKHPRATRIRPEIGTLRHYAQVALVTAVVTCALFPWLEWKGAVSFLPLWVIFELFYRSRLRESLKCTQCGFDPVLYIKDVGLARKEVEAFWSERLKSTPEAPATKNSISSTVSS